MLRYPKNTLQMQLALAHISSIATWQQPPLYLCLLSLYLYFFISALYHYYSPSNCNFFIYAYSSASAMRMKASPKSASRAGQILCKKEDFNDGSRHLHARTYTTPHSRTLKCPSSFTLNLQSWPQLFTFGKRIDFIQPFFISRHLTMLIIPAAKTTLSKTLIVSFGETNSFQLITVRAQ